MESPRSEPELSTARATVQEAGTPAARSPRPPLAVWLFMSTIVTTVVAVGAVAISVDRLVQRQGREQAERLLRASAEALRDGLDRGMAQHVKQVGVLSGLHQISRASRAADVRSALDGFIKASPEFAWLGLTDVQGRVVAGANGLLEGVDVSARPWFKGASERPFVGDVHEALLLAKLLPRQDEPWRFVDIAFPVRDEKGQLNGVLGAHLSWAWASELKRELSDRLANEVGAQAVVVSAKGSVLLGPPELQGKQLAPGTIGDPDYLWAQASTTGHGQFGGLGWRVLVRQPTRQAMAPYEALHVQIVRAASIVIAMSLPLLWWLARRLSRPLVDVTRAMQGDGEAHEGSGRALYREAQELRTALIEHDLRHARQAAALEAMADSLEQRVAERTRQLAETNERLSLSVQDLARSEERVASILRQSPDAFVATDALGRIIDWNPAAEALFGWRRHEVEGAMLSTVLIPEEHRSAHDAGMAAFRKVGVGPVIGKRLELPTLLKDGTRMTAEMSIGALSSPDGYLAFAFIRDIRERLAAQELLQQSRQRLQQVLGTIPAMVGYFDSDVRCRYSNEAGRRLRGLAPGEEIGLHLRDAIGEENYRLHEPLLPKVLQGNRAHFEGSVVQRGRQVHFQAHMVPERNPQGDVTGFYLMTFDITALKQAQLDAEKARRRLRAITDNLPVMISYIDADHRLQFLNRTFEEWTGVAITDALGKRISDVIGPQLYEQRRVALEKALLGHRVEFEVESETLGVRRILQTAYVPDCPSAGVALGVYTLTTDVTALRDAEQRMAQLALSDALTGLANRRHFEAQLPLILARARRSGTGTALMFMDIDHFKRVNDTFGHAAGDAVLVAFATRLAACIRSTDLVARLAGDEFVVVLEGMHDSAECHVIANKVNASARAPIDFESERLGVTTSIGLAYLPAGHQCTPEQLLNLADGALYRTKERGRDGYTTVMVGETEAEFVTSDFAAL